MRELEARYIARAFALCPSITHVAQTLGVSVDKVRLRLLDAAELEKADRDTAAGSLKVDGGKVQGETAGERAA